MGLSPSVVATIRCGPRRLQPAGGKSSIGERKIGRIEL
jgi:hypothetical protein